MTTIIARCPWFLLSIAGATALKSIRGRILQSSGCSTTLTTDASGEQTIYSGLLFAIESAATDTVGPVVISMGFHVDPNLMPSNAFAYEVYALNVDGYYADPNRGESLMSSLEFDYRADLGQWSIVAEGSISKEDLDATDSTNENYFEIPVDDFYATSVPPNAGQKAFYVTLKSPGMISADPLDQAVNDEAPLVADSEANTNSPKILIGEAVINYPLTDNSVYLFSAKAFMGRVIFEKACPTNSPSISIVPSPAPTAVSSYSPSESPSYAPSGLPSIMTSSAPSIHSSEMPSIDLSDVPSESPTIKVEEVRSGLFLSLDGPECKYDANGNPLEMSAKEQAAVAETVKENSRKDAETNGIANTNVTVVGFNAVCGRRLSSTDGDGTHRQLPSDSAAVEFSMLITGEFRPLENENENSLSAKPEPRNIDLGVIAEESINRDPDQFVRELKDRAPPESSLNEVTSIEVEAMEAPPEGVKVVFTRSPTRQPTYPLGTAQIQAEESGSNGEKAIFLACIIAITGIIVIVGAFLAFRMAGRRALARHKEEMESRKRKRERARRRQKREIEEDAHSEWVDDKNQTTY